MFAAALLTTSGCGPNRTAGTQGTPRPSVLLLVVDTLRFDAVSTTPASPETTPAIRSLGDRGVRFTHAYAPAPWTIASHASLFSGLGPEKHRVGIRDSVIAPPALEMLAERLSAGGYQTAGFSENTLVSEPFGMAQGFETFRARTLAQTLTDINEGASTYDVVAEVSAWADKRDRNKPAFVFVNLFDPHDPYRIHSENPFLPTGVSRDEAAAVDQSEGRLCERAPRTSEWPILKGLYLGDAHAADKKVAAIVAAMEKAIGPGLITVVTADHGEHLGENRLVGHAFTVRSAALHIPLIVTGLPAVPPKSIDTPVTLMDVTASLLKWTVNASDDSIDGRPLPIGGDTPGPSRSLLAVSRDLVPADWPIEELSGGPTDDELRAGCGPSDPVHGQLSTLIRYPYKLNWYAQYPPELYDLGRDPFEEHNLAREKPEIVESMLIEGTERLANAQGVTPPAGRHANLDGAAREALRSLGYDH